MTAPKKPFFLSLPLPMKKATATTLLILFLFSTFVPVQIKEELAKLPDLLEHYMEHKTETPGLSFFRFCKMHYGEDFAQHQDAHDHSGLPMKHHCENAHAAPLALLPPQVIQILPQPEFSKNNAPIFTDQTYQFSLLQDIWQPPRA